MGKQKQTARLLQLEVGDQSSGERPGVDLSSLRKKLALGQLGHPPTRDPFPAQKALLLDLPSHWPPFPGSGFSGFSEDLGEDDLRFCLRTSAIAACLLAAC